MATVDSKLSKRQKIVAHSLNNALHYLMLAAPQMRNVDGARLVQFDEFLEQNELELAMSQIAELGLGYPCCGVFLVFLKMWRW